MIYTVKHRPHTYCGSRVCVSKRPWHVYTPHCEFFAAFKTKEAAERAAAKYNQ